jgi:hypothetical protein
MRTALAFVILLLATLHGHAQGIDFTVELKDQEDIAFIDELSDKKPPLTLGLASYHALLFQMPGETVAGEDKFKRGALAAKVMSAKDVLLPSEDVTLIKSQIGKLYAPAIVYATWLLLDPGMRTNK